MSARQVVVYGTNGAYLAVAPEVRQGAVQRPTGTVPGTAVDTAGNTYPTWRKNIAPYVPPTITNTLARRMTARLSMLVLGAWIGGES